VIAPDQIAELYNGQRAASAQRDEQWEKRTIEIDIGLPQQSLIALRTVQETKQLDQ
jgi:hypothetical protein